MSVPPRGRPPTDLESSDYQLAFPFLKGFSITGEADPSYDCVSFTATPHAPMKLQPAPALVELGGFKALDVFYRERNFCRLDSVPNDHEITCIAVFGLDDKPTHVALRDRHAEWWESKLGAGIRILHRLAELEGGRYGRIISYYARPRATACQDPSGPSAGAREEREEVEGEYRYRMGWDVRPRCGAVRCYPNGRALLCCATVARASLRNRAEHEDRNSHA